MLHSAASIPDVITIPQPIKATSSLPDQNNLAVIKLAP